MQVRFVDAIKVKRLKERAVRCMAQNVTETRIAGETVKKVLECLDLWDDEKKKEGSDENARADIDHHNDPLRGNGYCTVRDAE